jgi:hypothetical protein
MCKYIFFFDLIQIVQTNEWFLYQKVIYDMVWSIINPRPIWFDFDIFTIIGNLVEYWIWYNGKHSPS